jgi:hypothetical protein
VVQKLNNWNSIPRKNHKNRESTIGLKSLFDLPFCKFENKCLRNIRYSFEGLSSLTSVGFLWYSGPNILGIFGSPFPWVI